MDDRWSSMKRILVATFLMLVILGTSTGQGQYGQYSFGAMSNVYGLGSNLFSDGLWWVQTKCPFGPNGYRTPSQFQCGTFSCPSFWFGSSSYQCPPPTLYSNSLQRCVHPSSLANSCSSSGYRRMT